MKKALLLFTMTLLGVTLMAHPVDQRQAVRVAQNFVAQRVKAADTASAAVVYTHVSPKSGEAAIYAVNVGGAFVLVGADDVAHPVLGYSFSRPWPMAPKRAGSYLPSQVSGYLDDLANQIAAAVQQSLSADADITAEWQELTTFGVTLAPKDVPDSVGPLLTTTWDQGQYYNALCPEDPNGPDGHCVTGCVATAMAQIINYWGYPIHGRGIHSYESNYGTLRVNYDSANYDYTQIPNVLTSSSTEEEIQAVATLMRDCGVATNMYYGSDGSGSNDISARVAMINHFRLSPKLSLAEKVYFSSSEWNNELRTNLANGRPVFYSGNGDNGGHAFVCDGYNQDNYFHFNFGWSGSADGWYYTSAVSPDGVGFNSNQSAILNIIPDGTDNVILAPMSGLSIFTVDNPLDFYHSLGNNTYEGVDYGNAGEIYMFDYSSNVAFVTDDTTRQLVIDVLSFEGQNVTIYDGDGATALNALRANNENDMSPIVSSSSKIVAEYQGNAYYAGFKLRVSQVDGCRIVSNIVTSIDASTIHLSWSENGDADQWQIEYGPKGFIHGEGSLVIVQDTSVEISGLTSFMMYDMYIRSSCGSDQYGSWSQVVSVMPEAPYWTDVVTSQPDGYTEDSQGNVIISSAEGLAWLSKKTEYENDNEFTVRNVVLTADISLGRYKWKPINFFSGIFDGQGHKIDSMYSIERDFSSTALIESIHMATLKNIILTNCYSSQSQYQNSSGLVLASLPMVYYPESSISDTIMNCFVSGVVEGNSSVAPIIAFLGNAYVINCASNCRIKDRGRYSMIGGIAGDGLNGGGGVVENCYSANRISSSGSWKGGVLGYGEYCKVENCYGYESRNYNMPLINGARSIFRDNVMFYKTDEGYILQDSLFFEPDSLYYRNLTDALNAGVRKYNIQGLKYWIDDTTGINEGMPILGQEYIVTCPNVRNLSARNIVRNDGEYGVALLWESTGDATSWEVRYHVQDSIDETRLLVMNNPDTVFGLEERKTYLFRVRPICSSTNRGGWSEEISHIFDCPYWTDIVTSQPDGYEVDSIGNVTISSAEGLAWFASVVNGLNGEYGNDFENKRVFLTQNVNMAQYKWTPIDGFRGSFCGSGKCIRGLNVSELAEKQGMFGSVLGGSCSDILLDSISVYGTNSVGMLIGYAESVSVKNCHANGIANGENRIGGLIGEGRNGCIINECSSAGTIYALYDHAGGLMGFSDVWDNSELKIRNCFSRCNVNAGRYSPGGLVGSSRANIENCYSSGNVVGSMYNGGLVGTLNYNNIKNCYFGGAVSKTDFYVINGYEIGYLFGAIVGSVVGNPEISHCYGLNDGLYPFLLVGSSDYDANGSVLGNPIENDVASFIDEGGSYELLNSVHLGDIQYTDLLSALNAWVDTYDTAGIYRHWAPDTANVNGGFPVFADIPCLQTTGGDSIIVCDSYTWHGVEYTENSLLVDTLSNMNGCDSIVTHHLIINHSNAGSESVTNCESYFFDGQWIYASGQYYDTLTSVAGCDSVVTLNLTINNPVHTAVTETACDSYLWHEATLTSTGDYTYPHNDANGCTQVDTLHLVINYSSTGDTSAVACDRFSWYQHTDITESTDMLTHTFINAAGCDSTVTFHLTINRSNTGDTTAVACDRFTWWNTNYTNSTNEATHVLTNAAGCDSTVTLHLTINYSNAGDTTAVACDRFSWYQHIDITESTDILTHTFINAAGCDSTVTLHLTINRSNTGDTSAVACDSFIWWNTNHTNSTNEATHVLTNAAGCDSTVTLHLTINHSNDTTITETIVQNQLPYTFSGESFNGSESRDITLSNIAGCDSVIHYTLNVEWNSENTVDSTVCASQLPLVWNGVTFNNAGTQPVTLMGSNGADSVVIMTLNIFPQSYGDTTATACESFEWYGETYNASGNYTHMLTAADMNGCDSILNMSLTINYNGRFSESITACDSLVWHGETFNQSGHYTFDTITMAGCDSTLTLMLTINHSTTGVFTVRACDEYTWHRYTYTESTDEPTYTMVGSNECDSVVNLHLTINHSSSGVETVTACNSYVWHDREYTESTDTATFYMPNGNAVGCDSTVTLNLTINHCSTTVLTVCDSYTWTSGTGLTYYESGEYVSGEDTLVLTVNHPVHTATTEAACDSYTWNGMDYAVSGDYTYSHEDANGCMQVDTLHLTINHSVHTSATETECDTYSWNGTTFNTSGDYTYGHADDNGCMQVDTLHLTINHSAETVVTDSAENSYTWNGVTYTESGTYTWVGLTAEGCDSTVTLHLTVEASQEGIDEADATAARIYAVGSRIVVDGAEGGPVYLYNAIGQLIKSQRKEEDGVMVIEVPAAGVYMVKVGAYPARKVVVIR